jgi:hypothetical protein
MPEPAEFESNWSQDTLRLLSVGLAVWVGASVATYVLLSNAGIPGQLSSGGMRAATLLIGFALGALALLAYGTVRYLQSDVTVVALAAAGGFFLLPPAIEVVWRSLSRAPATLAPGLLAILIVHAGLTAVRAARSGRRIDRVLVPETALLLLGLGLAIADLAPTLTTVGALQ